jgi:hypothetical protein
VFACADVTASCVCSLGDSGEKRKARDAKIASFGESVLSLSFPRGRNFLSDYD